MPSTISQPSAPKLSICITTFNRAGFIGATLDSILPQLTDDCEVVVLDGASTDETQKVVTNYEHRFNRLRYIRQETNNGVDRDYDRVVQLAGGKYCWLMTDDDLLAPGAVVAVLESLQRDFSLVLVNVEIRDFGLSAVLQNRWLGAKSNRVYGVGEMDGLFRDVGNFLKYIGGVVINREVWLMRERERYYGSWFVHVGVIFQKPLPNEVLVMAKPFVILRAGNTHTYSEKVSEILYSKWPSLAGSLALSESARGKVDSVEPWNHFQYLVRLRALGHYSMSHYKKWIRPRLNSVPRKLCSVFAAVMPEFMANVLCVLYYSLGNHHLRGLRLHELEQSPFHLRNWCHARARSEQMSQVARSRRS